MPDALTDRQREALEAIREHIADNPAPPTVRELAEAIGVTATPAQSHLEALDAKGWIDRTGDSRGITVLHTPEESTDE